MSMVIDFDKPLTDEEKAYLLNRGTPEQLRRAGLSDEDPNLGLGGVPDSMEKYEVDGSGQPVFDLDSKVADESVGEPGALEGAIMPVDPPPKLPDPVPFKANESAAPAQKATPKAKA
jgi:hypothetical protein